jgi:hypothetical protein
MVLSTRKASGAKGIDTDIISAFLETPSDEAIMKLIGHILLTRDPNAPAEPTSIQRRQV